MAHIASLVHGSNMSERAARALISGGRASSSRSSRPIVTVSEPVTPHADTTVRRFPGRASGMAILPAHIGSWPSVTVGGVRMGGAGGCLCDCHGTGDTSGYGCDIPSCGEWSHED